MYTLQRVTSIPDRELKAISRWYDTSYDDTEDAPPKVGERGTGLVGVGHTPKGVDADRAGVASPSSVVVRSDFPYIPS